MAIKKPKNIVVQYAKGVAVGKALDIGCGAGAESKYLAQKLGYEVDAIDSNGENKRYQTDGITWHTEDIREFFLQDDTYSLIIAINSFQFLGEDINMISQKIQKSLQRKGRFICSIVTRTARVDGRQKIMLSEIEPFISLDTTKKLFQELKLVLIAERWIYEPPHHGATAPHVHSIIEFVGDKI